MPVKELGKRIWQNSLRKGAKLESAVKEEIPNEQSNLPEAAGSGVAVSTVASESQPPKVDQLEDFHSKCTIQGGFMTHWTHHYYDEDKKRFHRKLWRFFSIFKMTMIIRIVWILSLYQHPNYPNLRVHVYLGTFAKFMGGPLHFTELIAFFWSLSESMMYHFCICRPREDFHWLKIFIFLNKANIKNLPHDITPKDIGLNIVNIVRLQRRAKVAFTMSSQYISQIVSGFPLIISLLFYFNFPTFDFVVYGLPWAMIWTLWTYCGCMAVYWLPSYFFVYCYYIKSRICTINTNLSRLLTKRASKHSHRNDQHVRNCLLRYSAIYDEIKLSNNYWTKYLTMTFFMYTLIICILLFFLLIAVIPWYTYIQYTVVILSGHCILLTIVIYSAMIVWKESCYTYKLLNKLANSRNLSLGIGTKIKIMSNLEKLKENREGFTIMTGQFLSSITFHEVSENIGKYFLLVIQNR